MCLCVCACITVQINFEIPINLYIPTYIRCTHVLVDFTVLLVSLRQLCRHNFGHNGH